MLVGFAVWGEVTRKATVPGLLMPVGGLIQVVAPQSGVISEWLVQEGAAVQAGQPLLRIKSERHTAQGEAGALNLLALAQRRASLEAELRLNEQQARQRNDALSDRLRSLQAEERQVQVELETSTQRLALAQRTVQRYVELAASGFVSALQAQQKQEELLDLQTRHSNAQRAVQVLQREQQSLKAEQQANGASAQAGRAQIERALAGLGQEDAEQQARRGVTVTAPQAGHVSAQTQTAGQTVQLGQPLLSLVPNSLPGASSLEAHLYASTRAAGFVRPGQAVWLRYAAFPYQKFGMGRGEVLRVSESPLSTPELPIGQVQGVTSLTGTKEPLRRIIVRLEQQYIDIYSERFALTAGLSLEADVIQEQRAIWEWLFEPIMAAKQHLKVLSTHPSKAIPGG